MTADPAPASPSQAAPPRPEDDAPATSDVRLSLPARAENVAVVRHVVSAVAEALELPKAVADDMRLALTEACTNVVRHAYGERAGTLEVLVRQHADRLEVTVADDGRGLGTSPASTGPGLGLPLIAALADSLVIEHAPASGSRLLMHFNRRRTGPAVRAA